MVLKFDSYAERLSRIPLPVLRYSHSPRSDDALVSMESLGSRASFPRVLAISSGGGHWVQLLRLRPAFEGCRVTFATVQKGYRAEVGDADFCVVPDAHRQAKLSSLCSALRIFLLILKLRPDVVVTTGAAPGYFAIRFGKLLGARTIWIDSIANAEELSLSGQMAKGKADLWLTQWPHLAKENKGGPAFRGNVL